MLGMKIAQNLSQEEAAFATLLANYDGCKRVLPPRATPTITQSGLLAVLLGHQRDKAIQSAWRHARQEKMRGLWMTLTSLFRARGARTLTGDSVKPLIGTVQHHT